MSRLPTADEIDGRRKRVGLSVAQLAANAGVAKTTLLRWINGNTDPTLATAQVVLDALDRAEAGGEGAA